MSTFILSACRLNVFVIFFKMSIISYYHLKSRNSFPKRIEVWQRAPQINEKGEIRDSNHCPHLSYHTILPLCYWGALNLGNLIPACRKGTNQLLSAQKICRLGLKNTRQKVCKGTQTNQPVGGSTSNFFFSWPRLDSMILHRATSNYLYVSTVSGGCKPV